MEVSGVADTVPEAYVKKDGTIAWVITADLVNIGGVVGGWENIAVVRKVMIRS